MQSNSCEFKKILAEVRNGDFAHPGEEQAIDIVFSDLPQQEKTPILDVGCGLGGTANYVTKHGWGKVTGIDIDPTSIEYARQHYPQIDFHVTDVINVANVLSSQFNIIYLFNSFYAFPQQEKALAELRKVANSQCYLAIFDYAEYNSDEKKPRKNATSNGEIVVPYPIQLKNIEQKLKIAGWQLISIDHLHDYYVRWYKELVSRINLKQQAIEKKFSNEAFALLHEIYMVILSEIEQKLLSGAIVRAKAI